VSVEDRLDHPVPSSVLGNQQLVTSLLARSSEITLSSSRQGKGERAVHFPTSAGFGPSCRPMRSALDGAMNLERV